MQFCTTFAIGLFVVVAALIISFTTGHVVFKPTVDSVPPLTGPHKIIMGMFIWTILAGVLGMIYCMGLFALLIIGK